MKNFTPREIVYELDKYIIGQHKAKKSVAVALRNRYRRRKLEVDFQEEIKPKNILMIGPTGVGKTEIARRLAKLVEAPFIKVEATKFTEVGYVGRDVESMVRDLVETSIRMVKSQKIEKVYDRAKRLADEKIINILVPRFKPKSNFNNPLEALFGNTANENEIEKNDENREMEEKREVIKQKLLRNELENKTIEIEIEENRGQTLEMFTGSGLEELNINMNDFFGGIIPGKKKKKKLTIKEARKVLANQEAQKIIDMDEITDKAIKTAENEGIIFIDEIDKIAQSNHNSGQDVSREGVQRDILPIIEGSTVMTKYGPVKTDHILFVAAGAFHVAKTTDLIPEIQGRFPIRVQLQKLSEMDFKEILVTPQNALIKQYKLLLETEGIKLEFTDEALEELARMAYIINEQTENIGARRLHTILEELLEEISFNAPDIEDKEIIIDIEYVRSKLENKIKEKDISKYIL
ncbi:ATP-dependent protease ATPase subunit HslU [Clostridiisalibacter paucivorans]|uniref:ATP-dependent protease ATPase subunit HslU n=1 Tax=Clostridiisalibacter paucivorans TaxID=408753 RepID=UPI00047D4739|nr:ATP-dependent protease ATPase subunit HslU [Clostridiisalibacter paucivorans]